jgi:hypothetical protein
MRFLLEKKKKKNLEQCYEVLRNLKKLSYTSSQIIAVRLPRLSLFRMLEKKKAFKYILIL